MKHYKDCYGYGMDALPDAISALKTLHNNRCRCRLILKTEHKHHTSSVTNKIIAIMFELH